MLSQPQPLVEIRGFKLRVGDYRVIVEVDNEIKILEVIKIGHRKNVYKKLRVPLIKSLF